MKKECVFTFKLSNPDRNALFATAATVEQTPSEFLRDLIRREARKKNLWNPTSAQLAGMKGVRNGN